LCKTLKRTNIPFLSIEKTGILSSGTDYRSYYYYYYLLLLTGATSIPELFEIISIVIHHMEYFVTVSKTTVEFKNNLTRLIKEGENNDDNIFKHQRLNINYHYFLFLYIFHLYNILTGNKLLLLLIKTN